MQNRQPAGVRTTQMKSLGASLITTVVDFGLFALCTLSMAGVALLYARWICGAVGALFNFLLNRGWAFAASRGRVSRQSLRYAVTALISVTLATAVWWGLRLATGLDGRLLHPVSMAVVWLAVSFPLLRLWVFRDPQVDATAA